MGEIWPKTITHAAPLIKQKLISNPPPSHNDNIKATTPPPLFEKSLLPLIPSYLLLVGFLPPVQTSLQMTLRRMLKSHLKSHQNHWTLSLCRLRMNWEIPYLLQCISSTEVPACVGGMRTRSINSAMLPLILRPFYFRYIFISLLVNAFTSFIYHTLNLYRY